MTQTEEERIALVLSKIQRAHQAWEETKVIIDEHLWYAAANRMYYSCFYMTSALLASEGISASTHAGTIRMLGMYFVSKGVVSQEMNKFYVKLFELRQKGDYDDYASIEASDVIPLIETAEEYMETIEKIIRNKINQLNNPLY